MADEVAHQKQLRELMEENFELELKLAKQSACATTPTTDIPTT